MVAKPVPPLSVETIERFYRKVVCGLHPNACWMWTGAVGKNRYGEMRVGDRIVAAHRIGYVIWNGPIPPELPALDHAGPDGHGCRSRLCVHPLHLEPVTVAENNRRARFRGEWRGGDQDPTQGELLLV